MTFAAIDNLAYTLPQVIEISDRALLLDERRQYTTDQQIDDLKLSVVFMHMNKNCCIDLNCSCTL